MMQRLVAIDDRLSLLVARLARAWCRATGTSSRALEYAVAVAIWALAILAVLIDPGGTAIGRGVNASFIAASSLYVFWPTTQRGPARAGHPVIFFIRLFFLAATVAIALASTMALLSGDGRGALGWALLAGNSAAIAALYYLLREPPAEPEPRARTLPAPSEGKA